MTPPNSIATQPVAINQQGAITGFYADANNVDHGFVRAVDGTISTFDAPGASTAPGQGTTPAAINAPGAVTGSYQDANNVFHGFLPAKDGAITTFDPTDQFFIPLAVSINQEARRLDSSYPSTESPGLKASCALPTASSR